MKRPVVKREPYFRTSLFSRARSLTLTELHLTIRHGRILPCAFSTAASFWYGTVSMASRERSARHVAAAPLRHHVHPHHAHASVCFPLWERRPCLVEGDTSTQGSTFGFCSALSLVACLQTAPALPQPDRAMRTRPPLTRLVGTGFGGCTPAPRRRHPARGKAFTVTVTKLPPRKCRQHITALEIPHMLYHGRGHALGTPSQGKKAAFLFCPLRKICEGRAMYPLDAYLSSSRNGCRGLSRAFTAGASRCIEPDGVGASAVGLLVQQSQR